MGVLRSLLGAFQFSGDEIDKRIRSLSGGEKSRLVMARMLFDPPNFLVLDEPTNHLDLATKDMLVAALGNFEGTMIFVSHDRTFLRGLSNRGSWSWAASLARTHIPTPTPGRISNTSSGLATKRRACTCNVPISWRPAPTSSARSAHRQPVDRGRSTASAGIPSHSAARRDPRPYRRPCPPSTRPC